MSVEITYGIIILAAGNSSRLGEPKQLLPYQNSSLLLHTIDQALALPANVVMVVTGASKEIIEKELSGKKVHTHYNANWSTGMGSSISSAVAGMMVLHPALDALLITVCDQPFLDAHILASLVEEHIRTGKSIVAAR